MLQVVDTLHPQVTCCCCCCSM